MLLKKSKTAPKASWKNAPSTEGKISPVDGFSLSVASYVVKTNVNVLTTQPTTDIYCDELHQCLQKQMPQRRAGSSVPNAVYISALQMEAATLLPPFRPMAAIHGIPASRQS